MKTKTAFHLTLGSSGAAIAEQLKAQSITRATEAEIKLWQQLADSITLLYVNDLIQEGGVRVTREKLLRLIRETLRQDSE